MQSISTAFSSRGLPVCVSGITPPLNHAFSKRMMADHDRRREVMKKQRSEARGGDCLLRRQRNHEMGTYRSLFEEVIEEMLMHVDGDRDLVAAILLWPDLFWNYGCTDPNCAAKAA